MSGLVTGVKQAENRISDAEDTLVCLDKTALQLRKQNEYLLEKVDQLENDSRRNKKIYRRVVKARIQLSFSLTGSLLLWALTTSPTPSS